MVPGSIINIPIGQWHSLKSLESGTILFEAKDGAYQPLTEDEILAPIPTHTAASTSRASLPKGECEGDENDNETKDENEGRKRRRTRILRMALMTRMIGHQEFLKTFLRQAKRQLRSKRAELERKNWPVGLLKWSLMC